MNTQTISHPKKKARIIKANDRLSQRVGTGPLDHRVVELCEKAMTQHIREQDFSEIAQDFLDRLEQGIASAKQDPAAESAMKQLTSPVMQLKGSAQTYNYGLVGNLATIMLGFLEQVGTPLNKDVIEIVEAHHKTLSLIIARNIEGDGGSRGAMFERELKSVCQRYFDKKLH